MQTITNYHRPSGLDEALDLLARESVTTAVIAGGTLVSTSQLPAAAEVVDIQDVADGTIRRDGDRLVFGAMARLQDLVDHEATPPLLAGLARREAPSTLRNAATIGGCVAAADPDSQLLAGLLVHDATVTLAGSTGLRTLPVTDLLADRRAMEGSIITSVSAAIGGETASVRTGRTPGDTPIVAAVARIVPDGIRVALTGVAATPVLVDRNSIADLRPSSDFRGSAEYRSELARVLTERVVAQLGGTA